MDTRHLVCIAAFLLVVSGLALGETRVSVEMELLTALTSGEELESWVLTPAGSAELAVRNQGSRQIRAELLLGIVPIGDSATIELRRLFARTLFGDVLATAGKTRSSWGAGIALNAGDILFGSDSVDFSLRASDPRSESTWLVNAEIPFGDFSFFETILLPGRLDLSDPLAPVLPGVDKSSLGGRINVAFADVTLQSGYLYRADAIASQGETGHHGYASVEGYVPFTWHLSAATRTPLDEWSSETVADSLAVTAGAFGDISLPADSTLTWQLETLLRPFAEFSEQAGATASEYGLFVYPGISLVPRAGLVFSLSALASPIDLSAATNISASWNIYESLTLLGFASISAGEDDDVFSINRSNGVSIGFGGRYIY